MMRIPSRRTRTYVFCGALVAGCISWACCVMAMDAPPSWKWVLIPTICLICAGWVATVLMMEAER